MDKKPRKLEDMLLVSANFSTNRDESILIVGRHCYGKPVEVINAFQGEEVYDLWDRLTTVKNKDDIS